VCSVRERERAKAGVTFDIDANGILKVRERASVCVCEESVRASVCVRKSVCACERVCV
jgi:molecular chaperone DnaK (HSP70)